MREGITWRAHYERVQEERGRPMRVLRLELFDEYTESLWGIFCDLSAGRTAGGMSVNPITWGDIEAWQRLCGLSLSPAEVRCVRELDTIHLEELNMSDEEVRRSFNELSEDRGDKDSRPISKAERLRRQKAPPKRSRKRSGD
jgi:hypothetical protein